MSQSQVETAVLVLADAHYGKLTSSYNTSIFRQRMNKLALKMAGIRTLLSDYTFDRLVVCCLGDLNDGTGIYPNQPAYQEKPDPRQQAKELSSFLCPWLLKLKETWGEVSFEGTPGNHGRSGKAISEAANWDLITYDFMKSELKNQIEVGYNDYGDGDPFIRKLSIRGHKYLLYHAHEIRMYSTIAWYSIWSRLQRWYTSELGPFDIALLGHFHTLGYWKINKIQALCTGTMASDDDWALRTLGMEPATQWWLFGVSNKHPLTWLFNLELT